MPAEPNLSSEAPSRSRRGAMHVAVGIFASRILGFARDRAIAHYFGLGPHADVFRTALRGPNLLQNLLGEGTISASFIPVYSRLLASGRAEDAGRLAGAVFGLLLAVAGGLSLLGVLAAKPIVAVLAAGFLEDAKSGAAVDRYQLTVQAVRYIFPMTGILVLSAWALGILNSHRRFLLSYAAPVLWNAAIIAALIWVGRGGAGAGRDHLLMAACVGALVGGALQFLVQLPLVLRLVKGLRVSTSLKTPGLAETLSAFAPAVLGLGALQLGGYLDTFLGSFLAPGAITAMGVAFTLYQLPVALLSRSVAVAALPELSRRSTDPQGLVGESELALRRLAFLNIPAVVAYLAFGSLIVAALYGTGSFGREESLLVYAVLAGYTVGLVASSFRSLLQSVCFALGDTATPARVSAIRVVVGGVLGVPAMLLLDRFGLDRLGGDATSDLRLGAVGLALVSGTVSWLDLWLLRRSVQKRLPDLRLPWRASGRILVAALLGAVPALAVWQGLPELHAAIATAVVLGIYGAGFLGVARLLRVPELAVLGRRFG